MKSSKFRQMFAPPPSQMHPRCTGSLGVASTVDQVAPPSNVVATYRCQMPVNFGPVNPPDVGVPRKANAARSLSPATTAGKTTLLIPNAAPTSSGALHVLPLSCEMLIAAVVSPSA